tara:strand:- start:19531 stop:19752 length:222 start_codon:yes stop_codon:yes gene_type:complete
MKQNCDLKIIYKDESDAKNTLAVYREQILFSTISHYHCSKHEGYHLGHNRRLSNRQILKIYKAKPKEFSNGKN